MAHNFCEACGAELKPGNEFCPKCSIRVPVVPVLTRKKQYPKDTPENRAKMMKEYKITVFEEVMSLGTRGTYDKTKLEDALNILGLDGWSVKKILMRQIPGLASNTINLIIILERDMPLEP